MNTTAESQATAEAPMALEARSEDEQASAATAALGETLRTLLAETCRPSGRPALWGWTPPRFDD